VTKGEIIEAVAGRYPHLSHRKVVIFVNAVFGAMTEALARGERIELRGFGSFCVKQRAARTLHNPLSGQKISLPAKQLPSFKAGKELRIRVADDPAKKQRCRQGRE
jgi:integration host factor subunit beta